MRFAIVFTTAFFLTSGVIAAPSGLTPVQHLKNFDTPASPGHYPNHQLKSPTSSGNATSSGHNPNHVTSGNLVGHTAYAEPEYVSITSGGRSYQAVKGICTGSPSVISISDCENIGGYGFMFQGTCIEPSYAVTKIRLGRVKPVITGDCYRDLPKALLLHPPHLDHRHRKGNATMYGI
ncbi:hypothetical protein AX17_003728 [Amanita inopinata Kibby_2008]|nr:hypothetical protein AX17_003728 [Amanita inopinata Kibby_2008]